MGRARALFSRSLLGAVGLSSPEPRMPTELASTKGGRPGMIAGGDRVARNAVRVGLLTASADETPLPVHTRQELDAGDILEVRDMAEAIARAEQMVAASRSSQLSS